MVRVAVLVSGGGTNLQAILDAEARGEIPHGRVSLVLSSRPGVFALERAAAAGVPTAVVARKDCPTPEAFDAALLAQLHAHQIDLVVLAGFLSILGASFIAAYKDRIINVHPSLIPSFCGEGYYGLRVHEAVLARGVKLTGATVHLVNEVCDGGAILLQKAVAVLPGDTPESLQRRVMEEAEWQLLPQAVELESLKNKEKVVAIMEIKNINNLLAENGYPGRGIVLGLTPDGTNLVVAYFIMGRSENSRNRVFTVWEEGIRTEAADPAKLTDPSLIIYAPVRVLRADGNEVTIVTNGDQTDTLYEKLAKEISFEEALRSRTFEPDGPNWTPRISGAVERDTNGAHVKYGYRLSILKSADGNGDSVRRFHFEYPQPVAGEGHFIHTYRCDGTPIPSFEGEPVKVAMENDHAHFAQGLWESLNFDNKVSLFVRYINIATGQATDTIFNKNSKEEKR